MIDYTATLQPGRVSIFLFHGVIREQVSAVRNYNRKHICLDEFVQLMRGLAAAGTAISIDEFLSLGDRNGSLPDNAFIVTFDDGFENNLTLAAPVLAETGIPATFYITSDFVTHNQMSWIDRIDEAFDRVSGGTVRLPWGTFDFASPSSKIEVLEVIRSKAKADPTISFDDFASEIQDQLGVGQIRSGDGELDRKLTWRQVAELADGPDFTIGGHTQTHAVLAHLDDSALDFEIGNHLSLLKRNAGIDTAHFAYPDGLEFCYNADTIRALKRHGVRCCPTAIAGTNAVGDDPFHLRRIPVI